MREIKKYFSHDSTSDEGMNIEISYLVERSHIAKLKEKKKSTSSSSSSSSSSVVKELTLIYAHIIYMCYTSFLISSSEERI